MVAATWVLALSGLVTALGTLHAHFRHKADDDRRFGEVDKKIDRLNGGG